MEQFRMDSSLPSQNNSSIMNDNNYKNSNSNSNNNDTFDSYYCDENDEEDNENNGTEYSSTDELEENDINDAHIKLSNSKPTEFSSGITSKVDLSELLEKTLKEVQYLKDECNILTEILLRKRYKNISEALPFNKRAGNSRKRKIVE